MLGNLIENNTYLKDCRLYITIAQVAVLYQFENSTVQKELQENLILRNKKFFDIFIQ